MGMHDVPVDADAVLDRMRETLNVATDLALCAALGVGSSVVSTWRHRKHVPHEECAQIALRKDVSLDWLVLGRVPCAALPPAGVAESTADYASTQDPRVTRMVRFIEAWPAGRDSDDVAWLERTLARNVQEYGEWLASQPADSSDAVTVSQDKSGP